MIRENLRSFNLKRIQLYINALRSGGYVQGVDVLHGEGCFCALGVAADVAIRHGARAKWIQDHGEYFLQDNGFFDNGEDWTDLALTQSIVDWYGSESLGALDLRPKGGWMDKLYISTLNDSLGWTFDQIAGQLEQLFFPQEAAQTL